MINYNEEVKRLDAFVPGEKTLFFGSKTKPGQYRVKALTELEDDKPFHKEGEEDKPQVKIELLIGEERFIWQMGKGVSPASAYGQLCHLGQVKGSLKNLDFMIVVTNDKKKNSYTIVTL